MGTTQDQKGWRDWPKVTQEISGAAIPRRVPLTWPFPLHHSDFQQWHYDSRTQIRLPYVTRTTPALPKRRRLPSESCPEQLAGEKEVVPSGRPPISPERRGWQAQLLWTPRHCQEPPPTPDPAPERLGSETSEKPPGEFRPLLDTRHRLGASQRAAGRPPEPAMCPARHARLARPAPHAPATARGPARDPPQRQPRRRRHSPSRPGVAQPSGPRPTPPAGPLGDAVRASGQAPRAGLLARLPAAAASRASLLHWAGAPQPHAEPGPWCPAGPR
jgi:hypothetical protein